MTIKLPSFFRPKFFDLFTGKETYNRKSFLSDLAAGVIVGIVAGFIISFFGGSHFLIGGPTGAFIVIVYGIVQQYGMNGLIIATVLAGAMLVVMGIVKLGTIIKYIPYPIIVGFTGGILEFPTNLRTSFPNGALSFITSPISIYGRELFSPIDFGIHLFFQRAE